MEPIVRLPGETDEQYDIRANKDVAAFSYVWIMAVIVYATRKESAFVRYHSKQGIILFIVSILVWFIPFFGQYLVYLIVAGMLMGFINAVQGKYADVPLVGPLAKGEMTITDLLKRVTPLFHRAIAALKTIFSHTEKPDNPTSPASPPSSPAQPVTSNQKPTTDTQQPETKNPQPPLTPSL